MRIWVQPGPVKDQNPTSKISTENGAGGMTHVVDCYLVCVTPQVQATLMPKEKERSSRLLCFFREGSVFPS
jgi:hypothetical protein